MALNSSSAPLASPADLGKRRRLSSSVVAWLALVLYLLLVKLILVTFLPNAFADPAQAAPFGWAPLLIIAALGLIGAWLAPRTGFPEAWDRRVSNRERLLFPVLTGLAFSLVYVALDLGFNFTALQAARHGITQQYTGFLSMLLVFSAGAIIVEVIYRLFPIPVLLWFGSNLLLKGKGQVQMFWVLAALTSLLEPLGMWADLQILPIGLMVFLGVALYSINFTQAVFFRRYGFLASILVRLSFYLVWHVLYIH
jgi:hypothetical protein